MREQVPAAVLCLTEERGLTGSAHCPRGPRTPGLGPPPCAARSAAQLCLLSSPLRVAGRGAKFTHRRTWPGRPRGPAAAPPRPPCPCGGRLGRRAGREPQGRARQLPRGTGAAAAGAGAGGTRRRRQPKTGLCLPPEGEGSHARQLRRRESRGLGWAPLPWAVGWRAWSVHLHSRASEER